jgi:transcriptional regulator with XRE-family HTH domain
MNIGDKLKRSRAEAGLTQEAVSEKVFVSRQTISNWENGKSYPDIVSVIALSDVYGVTLDSLLKGDNNMLKHLKKNTVASVRKRVAAGVLIVLAVAFALVSAAWLVHYNLLIKPMLNDESFIYLGKQDGKKLYVSDGDNAYTFVKVNGQLYYGDAERYSVVMPEFLRFEGGLSVNDGNGNDSEDYSRSVSYKPRLFKKDSYDFIIVYGDAAFKAIGADEPVSFEIRTDKDFNLLSESEPGVYDKYIDDLILFFEEDAVGFFGEDVF